MDLVAQEAGAARRTLYNQFPKGREALFHAVVERVWSASPVMDIVADVAVLADPELGLRRIGEAVAAPVNRHHRSGSYVFGPYKVLSATSARRKG